MSASAEKPAPGETRGERVAYFLGRSFPPALLVPACTANFLALSFAFQALAKPGELTLGPRALAGAATVVLFSLFLRMSDELKDVKTDVRLGQAGDPRYKDRPIVTGHIREDDLKSVWWCTVGLLLAFNLPFGFSVETGVFGCVFALLWLSSRWFFVPAISKSILAAFATHNPLTLAVESYVLALAAGVAGPAPGEGAAAVLVGLWFPVAAWETSRKLRAPAFETDYETYSKALGWKTAALVPAAFVAVSAVALELVGAWLELGWAFAVALALAALVSIGACVRFRVTGENDHAKLEPAVSLYGLVANVALAVTLVAKRGVVLA